MASNWKSAYLRYKEVFLNVTELYKKRADLRAFLEIVLSIIAVLVFLVFAIKPTALTIISLVQQINEEKKVISILDKKLNDLKKANNIVNQYQPILEIINTAIPSSPNPDLFAKQVEGLAVRNEVDLVGISMKEIVVKGQLKSTINEDVLIDLPNETKGVSYVLNVRGFYNNINNFITNMGRMRVISIIDNVSISSSTTNEGKTLIAVISGRIPYLYENR